MTAGTWNAERAQAAVRARGLCGEILRAGQFVCTLPPHPDRPHSPEQQTREQALVKGLCKAVADPDVEWVDANILRLLLDRYRGGS